VTTGIFNLPKQGEYVPARNTSVDSVFMLKTDQVIAVEIEKLGGSFIGGQSSWSSSRRTWLG
jgi:hypothetical protein